LSPDRQTFRGRGSLVTTAEVYQSGKVVAVRAVEESPNVFGDAFVVGGEQLLTTTVVPMPDPDDDVLGWSVELKVYAPNRMLRFDLIGRVFRWRSIRCCET
jgi:hypothetical protein